MLFLLSPLLSVALAAPVDCEVDGRSAHCFGDAPVAVQVADPAGEALVEAEAWEGGELLLVVDLAAAVDGGLWLEVDGERHQSEIAVQIDHNHLGTDTVSVNINQSHREAGELAVNIDQSHRDTDLVAVQIDHSHRGTDLVAVQIDHSHRSTDSLSVNIDQSHLVLGLDAEGVLVEAALLE